MQFLQTVFSWLCFLYRCICSWWRQSMGTLSAVITLREGNSPATGGFPHTKSPLRWRHNDHDSVSNHQPHDCLYRRRSKKTSKFRVTGLCVGNSPGPVNSPHKGPVTRKMFPFDDVIMQYCVIFMFSSMVTVEQTVWLMANWDPIVITLRHCNFLA